MAGFFDLPHRRTQDATTVGIYPKVRGSISREPTEIFKSCLAKQRLQQVFCKSQGLPSTNAQSSQPLICAVICG